MKKIINWRHNGRRVKVKFRCCDSCGVGFGTTKYPDGDVVQPEKEPKIVKIYRPYVELCSSCYERYHDDIERIGELTRKVRDYYRFQRKKRRMEARRQTSKARARRHAGFRGKKAAAELRRKIEDNGGALLEEGA